MDQLAALQTEGGPLIHADFRALFGADDWRALQACVVLVCRDVPHSGGDEQGWEALDQALARIAEKAASSQPDDDLALTLLAELAAPDIRHRVLAEARAMIAETSEAALRAMTERAAAIVDQACCEQGFRFRATLILVSMLVAGEASR